jgi:hypothetical protein
MRRDFPETANEFEARFATEEDCWIEPASADCASKRAWAEIGSFLLECAECDHQTSLRPEFGR